MPNPRSVLVVDDLAEGRRILGEALNRAGFEVAYASDGREGLRAFARVGPDLVVTDVQMPRLDGIGLVRRIREVSSVPIVMVTAFGSIPDCEEAMRVGADRYLELRRDLPRIGELARNLVESHAFPERRVTPREGKTGATAAEVRRLARMEFRAVLEELLLECRGNIAEVARRIGRDRSTIRYHLRRMGLLGDDGRSDIQKN